MDQNLLDPSAIRRESEFESGGEGRGAAEVSFNLISTHDDDGHARFNSEIRKIDEWNCSIRRILKRGMRLRIIGDVFQFGRLEWRF